MMENPHEEQESDLTILPPLFWVAIICLAFGLIGCSTSPRSEVCQLQILGQTETGVPVVMLLCVSPEEFQESQK